jgi:sodium-dependent phosphate cotransporter
MRKASDPELTIKAVPSSTNPLAQPGVDSSLSVPGAQTQPEVKKRWWAHIRYGKLVLFVVSLYLFILAIMLMKDGARIFTPFIHDTLAITSIANSLGFGWIFAYLIMSGSPVAAAALTFFDSGVIDKLGAFAMITGSRFGASFIVLVIGFLYVLRGRNRATSLGMGILSLSITWSTYLPAFFLGIVLLQSGSLDLIQLSRGTVLNPVVDIVIGPLAGFISALFPKWVVFIFGLGIIYLSFNLFDRCLPQVAIKESQLGWASRLVYRPAVMFIFGALVTLISMSVSISLSILVPLSNRGFIRRENVIPYIMGANITTFIDTMLAAVLLGNPHAFTIVLVEMLTVTIISLVVLVFFYPRYQKAILEFVNLVTRGKLSLAIFLITIIIIPVLLVII